MIKLETLSEEIRDAFETAFPTPVEFDYDDFGIYKGDDKYASLFEKISNLIATDKELDTILLTKCRYSVSMHTDKIGIENEKLNKEVWLIPITVNGSWSYPDQFIRYEVENNKTHRDITYSDIIELSQFEVFRFNAKKPHAYINNSCQYAELMSLWFKR